MRALVLASFSLLLAGCVSELPGIGCTNAHPRGTDCSYTLVGLQAVATYANAFDARLAAEALANLSYLVHARPDGHGVVASREGHTVNIERASEGTRLRWEHETPYLEGLTTDEVAAEAARRCAEGPADELRRVVEGVERATGWTRTGGADCSPAMVVA